MCNAIPIALFLLALFAAGTLLRFTKPTSSNADLVTDMLASLDKPLEHSQQAPDDQAGHNRGFPEALSTS